MFKEYKEYDALGLSELLKKKEVSAKELLEEAIFLTETLDPLINAVPQKHFEPVSYTHLTLPTNSGV